MLVKLRNSQATSLASHADCSGYLVTGPPGPRPLFARLGTNFWCTTYDPVVCLFWRPDALSNATGRRADGNVPAHVHMPQKHATLVDVVVPHPKRYAITCRDIGQAINKRIAVVIIGPEIIVGRQLAMKSVCDNAKAPSKPHIMPNHG
jgi:hypothetical protein